METIVLVHTGFEEKYCNFFPTLIESANKFFSPHETLIFANSGTDFGATRQVRVENPGYQMAILKRYHTILSEKEWLSQFDNILVLDADLVFVDYVRSEDIFVDGITVMTHPWIEHELETWKSPYESRPESSAYVDGTDYQAYYQGCLVGGRSTAFFKMAETIVKGVDEDLQKGIVSLWLDESHMNHYMYLNPPARVLPSTYCYPAHWPKVDGIKMLHNNSHSDEEAQKVLEQAREWKPQ